MDTTVVDSADEDISDPPIDPDAIDPDVTDLVDTAHDTLEVTDPDVDVPEGNCTSDGDCGGGEICRPLCFPGDGCGTPPSSIVVDCPEEVTLPAMSTCTIDLDGVSNQIACLDCEARLGLVTLSNDDFGTSGSCSLGDWTLVGGSGCFGSVTDCTIGGAIIDCCSDEATILDTFDGDCRLVSDLDTNCGGSFEEWRLTRTFDTSGLQDLEICFRVGGHSATGNEGIIVIASDTTSSAQVHCTNSMPVEMDGTVAPDDLEWPVCASLPLWAGDNPALAITFVAHSENAGQAMHLDDVVVRGWSTPCIPSRTTLFTEDFSSCTIDSTITTGHNGWSVSGSGTLECVAGCGSGKTARARRNQSTMTHIVDTTAIDDDLRLCFDTGDEDADAGEEIVVFFDTGSGWQQAWKWENDFGIDGSCSRVCIVLTDLDPAAAGISDLEIRFDLDSSHNLDRVFLDEIVVDGASYCPAGSAAHIGGLTDLGDGSYSLDLVDDAATQMASHAHCSWDSPDDPLESEDGTWFR